MTFRAKPVVKRAQRPAWEGQDRRNFYLNIGFGIVVLAALVILVIAGALTWYDEHLASVGSVDGQSITKDEFRDRYQIESWRLDETERRIRTAVVAGQLSEADAQSQIESLGSSRNQLPAIALERLIDSKLQAKLAVEEGITTTPEDVDAKLLEEATTPERRHAWMIAVAPELDPGALSPTAAQQAAAKSAAEAALKQIQGGKAWEEVATATSTDAASAPQGGDLGWLKADDTQLDEAYLTAVFAAEVNTPTTVMEGADGTYRIGRVTEIAAKTVDDAYQSKLTNDGIDLNKYRTVVLADVIHQKLEDKIVAQVSQPGPQRHVQEIFIAQAAADLGADAIKVRHILYSPNHDPANAATLDANDPAWAAAEELAQAAYLKLKDQPELFDAMARTDSDEGAAQGLTGTGGKLPYFDSASGIDEAFAAAILKPGLKAGDLLEPVRSSFGWHVIQVMYLPPDLDRLNAIKALIDKGEDFATLARDNSEGQEAGAGGDIGWVAKGQLDASLIDAIFATEIGKTTDVVTVDNDGLYLFKVLAEEVRTPEGRQLEELRSTAFSDWYNAKKGAADIVRDESYAGSLN
ncbi:MAG TPA: peptidylprolyl isomerase [Candidatus Limnocylindrales bacterium]|nr:peptidylprolyl isomerase [Candidatus Limnocylindrales bacterium]